MLFKSYGRVGESGRPSTESFSSESSGRGAFEKQFKAKTGNVWGTTSFVKKSGKYFMSEVSYEEELKKIPDMAPIKIPDSKLDDRVQKLITLLSDVNMINKSLVSLDIDTKKMPLGKIKQTQLDKAGDILMQIQPLINDMANKKGDLIEIQHKLTNLSSEYYTFLPMAFGRKKPPIINTVEMVGKYRDVLDELKNMVVNIQITENVKNGENQIDSIYNGINTTITPLDKKSKMWIEIEKYVANTHGATHNIQLEIIDIFEVEQMGKKIKFEEYCKNISNRTLLFHGSGMSNFISILKNDLLLNPQAIKKDVVITGKMFSDGIYWANAVSKSWGYCRTEVTNGVGCLALAEIALGNISKKINADYTITEKSLQKSGHHSVQGIGKYTPDAETIVDNIKIPNGQLKDINTKTSLIYDEFVIYNSTQQLIKYLIIVKNKNY